MGFEFKSKESIDIKSKMTENFKEIKPKNDISNAEAKQNGRALFEKNDNVDKEMNQKEKLENDFSDYQKELKEYSAAPDTIPENPIDFSELKRISPEENAIQKGEFNRNKDKLISEWEKINDKDWPTYKEDVVIIGKSGQEIILRKAGDRYDAHHDIPTSLGGKNEASNITPIKADLHYDHKGIHRADGPCDRLMNDFKEINND